MTDRERCPWCLGDALYQEYHDREWGVPEHRDQRLFEFLILEGAQAGPSQRVDDVVLDAGIQGVETGRIAHRDIFPCGILLAQPF